MSMVGWAAIDTLLGWLNIKALLFALVYFRFLFEDCTLRGPAARIAAKQIIDS